MGSLLLLAAGLRIFGSDYELLHESEWVGMSLAHVNDTQGHGEEQMVTKIRRRLCWGRGHVFSCCVGSLCYLLIPYCLPGFIPLKGDKEMRKHYVVGRY